MITLELKRGNEIPEIVMRHRGRETGKSIVVDASELDIAIEVALKWGNTDDSTKAIDLIDPATDEQITISAAAGAVAGVQLKDIQAPFLFLAITTPSGKVAPEVSAEAETPADVTADITATVNPGGSETSVYVELGTETGVYGDPIEVDESPLAASADDESVSVTLSDLTAETDYFYRIKAVNSLGTTYGEEQTFTTTATE